VPRVFVASSVTEVDKGEKGMNRKGILALIVALLLAAVGATALAQNNFAQGAKHANFRGRHFGERMAAELGLTDQQKTQIQQILQNEKANVQPLREQLRNQHQQMLAATRGGAFDEPQVRTIANQQAQTQANLMVEREKVKAEIYKVLTPDQRAKADQLQAQFANRGRRGLRGQKTQAPPQQQ
jgi:Spy/CpxP family protein refolding chaperone